MKPFLFAPVAFLGSCSSCSRRVVTEEAPPGTDPDPTQPFEYAIQLLTYCGGIAVAFGVIGGVLLAVAGLPRIFTRLASGLAAGGFAALICAAGLRWFSEHTWLIAVVSVIGFAAYMWFFQRKFVEQHLGDLNRDGKIG